MNPSQFILKIEDEAVLSFFNFKCTSTKCENFYQILNMVVLNTNASYM